MVAFKERVFLPFLPHSSPCLPPSRGPPILLARHLGARGRGDAEMASAVRRSLRAEVGGSSVSSRVSRFPRDEFKTLA